MTRFLGPQYSDVVLRYALGNRIDAPPVCSPVSRRIEDRLVKAIFRRPTSAVVLAGFGCGHVVTRLACELPPDISLVVVEWNMETARQARACSFTRPVHLVADTSAMALFCLLRQSGLTPDNTLFFMNPEHTAKTHTHVGQTVKQLFFKTKAIPLCTQTAPRDMTFAAIVSPQEPDLLRFAKSIPRIASQTVLVWDALEVPVDQATIFADVAGVIHLARPLEADFAAQRNAMLELCQSEMVFSLDADEYASPALLEILPTLVSMDVDVVYFPRLTLYPDAQHAKIGYGLWPDVQPRLFRQRPGVHYSGTIHERLEGTGPRAALMLGAPLFHLQMLLKDHKALAEKLRTFDTAAPSHLRHQLSHEYPCFPVDDLVPPSPELLLLP